RKTQDLTPLVILLILTSTGCLFFHGQRYRHFTTPAPLSQGEFLVLGFMGGREPWDNEERSVRKLALRLQSMRLPIHVETVENKKRDLAVRLIQNAFDSDQDGRLSPEERSQVRLIVYGQSFGGAAVVKLANQLQDLNIPILLTVQVDSVGLADAEIPPNVAAAANLFQRNGLVIRGEPEIYAEDPARTRIIGNFEFDYSDKEIDISHVSWFKKIFRVAHTKMEYDPEVWAQVEDLILAALKTHIDRNSQRHGQ
ncbi:MAG: hypothetical protein ACRD1R_00435, partial [Acidobacteriota bacterium]